MNLLCPSTCPSICPSNGPLTIATSRSFVQSMSSPSREKNDDPSNQWVRNSETINQWVIEWSVETLLERGVSSQRYPINRAHRCTRVEPYSSYAGSISLPPLPCGYARLIAALNRSSSLNALRNELEHRYERRTRTREASNRSESARLSGVSQFRSLSIPFERLSIYSSVHSSIHTFRRTQKYIQNLPSCIQTRVEDENTTERRRPTTRNTNIQASRQTNWNDTSGR